MSYQTPSENDEVRISWTEQLQRHPHYRDMTKWPEPDLSRLEPDEVTAYDNRKKALKEYFESGSVKAAAAVLECSLQFIYYLLSRCLSSLASEPPPLLLGLVPNERLLDYERKAASDGTTGLAGAFANLQREVPEVFEALSEHLKNELKRTKGTPVLDGAAFNQHFLNLLERARGSKTGYPFNTPGHARESLRLWRRQEIHRLSTPRPEGRRILVHDKYRDTGDAFQLDGHQQDFNSYFAIDLGGGRVRMLRVARIWILVLIEVVSTAIFGMAWGFSRQVRQDDFLDCLGDAVSIWTPFDNLPPPLKYPDRFGAGHPSMLEPFRHFIPYVLQVDNAWAHLALAVKAYLHKAWISCVNWGLPAVPIARRAVEMAIARLAVNEHRFPNTVGNSPFDPRRDPHPRRVPVTNIRDVPAVFDVIRAEINSTSRADLFNLSPMETLQTRFDRGLIVRTLPEEFRDERFVHTQRRNFTIRGNPVLDEDFHVNWAYESYKGDVLRQLMSQGIRDVPVDIFRKDIRKMTVVGRDGRPIGEIQHDGPWAAFPHDERLRRAIYRECGRSNMERPNTIATYLTGLADSATSPSRALKLYDVLNRIGAFGEETSESQVPPPDEIPPPKGEDPSDEVVWRPH